MQQPDLQRTGINTAGATLKMTQELLDRHGERITGTEQCLLAAQRIADLLRSCCDRVSEETFELHPGSMWHVGRIIAVSYALALIFWAVGGRFTWVALPVCVLSMSYGVTHYILCGKLFDRLFPAAVGCNIVGIIEPHEDVRQQIIISGHHDSPYVLSFLQHAQAFAGVRLLLAIAAYLLLTTASLVAAAAQALGQACWRPTGLLLALPIAGLLFVLPLYNLITRTPSPGAGDNLNASAMAIRLARLFAAARQQGAPLRHTRLILLSTDGEEAGQRGAIAYADLHRAELLAIPSYVFNIDSVYKLQDLAALVRDRHSTLALSTRMAEECCQLAADLGIRMRALPLPLGGGGTDAAAFARLGVQSTTIIGIPTTLRSHGLVYHTLEDTVEHIQPAAVAAVLDIAFNYVLRKDRMMCDLPQSALASEDV